MRDALGRQIDYLRLSITDRCNLRCRYCMPEEVPFLPHESILRYEEILRLVRISAELGMRTIKVTGGEPLVRKDCVKLLRELKAIPGIEHVTLTTNGVLLSNIAQELKALGLDGVNISLDTMDAARYRRITGRDEFGRVIDGLRAAVAAQLRVKVNCVPLAETEMDDLLAVAALAARYPVDVRFIEMMPMGHGRDFTPVDCGMLLNALRRMWPGLVSTEEKRGFGPAVYWTAPGLLGAVGFISAVSHTFCASCNRVRLTSEGFLKSCLCFCDGVDLRALLRAGASDEALHLAMEQAIRQKPACHSFGTVLPAEGRGMSQIGG